ncbi:hypothetical protein [Marinoscillum luteum]|uniref:Uncharacterized protein n=1 Tax=Marinoscillum luteum TaxID=861051 RepID=A0ABW7N8Z1_9BACT
MELPVFSDDHTLDHITVNNLGASPSDIPNYISIEHRFGQKTNSIRIDLTYGICEKQSSMLNTQVDDNSFLIGKKTGRLYRAEINPKSVKFGKSLALSTSDNRIRVKNNYKLFGKIIDKLVNVYVESHGRSSK